MRNENALVSIEIMAEVVYVLKGVYGVGRQKIGEKLIDFLNEVSIKTFDKKLNKLLD